MNKSITSTCPYATNTKSIVKEAPSSSTQSSLPAEKGLEKSRETLEAIALAKKACPAFRGPAASSSTKATCPFRTVNDASSFKKTMLSIPASHYVSPSSSPKSVLAVPECNDMNDLDIDIPKQFGLALQHMHQVSQALHGKNDSEEHSNTMSVFLPDGGCPFKSYYDSEAKETIPFVAAMEGFSFNTIMADMAASPDHKASAVESKVEEATERELRDSLSTALKTGTAASHKAAENVHFVKEFLQQKVRLDLYKQMIVDLYFTYRTLERQLDIHGPTHFPSLYQPDKLARTASLEQDLAHFYGPNWKQLVEITPAIQDYVDRIDHVANTDPILLLSHAYTRYLGDLSGGRVLQRIAKKALNLSSDKGLLFYNFDNIPSAKQFKQYYRCQLDQLVLSDDKIQKLVHEANVAFILNMRMFEQLDVMSGEVPDATVRPLRDALFFNAEEENKKVKNKGCPFATMAKEGQQALNKKCPMQKLSDKTKRKTCPWPFVFMHDPKQGMKHYQTWIVIGLFFSFLYKCL